MNRAVVYYSLSGNTKEAAKIIARKLGAKSLDRFSQAIPKNTVRQMLVGGMQSTFGRRPKIKGVPDNINYYDEIILGMPVWAGMPASPVNTFIKSYGVADKIDAVFTFSGGGDNDRCLLQLSKSLKNLKNQVALADRNSDKAKDNEEKLDKFVMR
ncbi:MAG: flavodoxin family protein [Lachnospira eligens]